MKKVTIIVMFAATFLLGWDTKPMNYSYATTQSKYGLEINPFRLILINGSWRSASGSLSIFDYVNSAEITFPILYSNENDFKLLTLDVHYRKFIENRVGGLYMSAIGRVASLEGELRASKIDNSGENYAKVTKFGLGLGIGYRFLPQYSRWYWGVGLIAGRYFGSDNDIFDSSSLSAIDDAPIFIDIELLKIGYRF